MSRVAAAGRDGPDARLPVPAAVRDRALRVQRPAGPGLADPGVQHEVVRRGAQHPERARGVRPVGQRRRSCATIMAIILGSLASFVVHRYRFFGREVISFALVLPIALPGHHHGHGAQRHVQQLRGPARDADDRRRPRHVLRRRRLQQRHRPPAPLVALDRGGLDGPRGRHLADVPPRDLPGPAHRASWRAALLAFALSFDEIIVTTFTAGTQETLPIWIFNHFRLPNQRPIVNVVALFLIVLSMIPVYLAQRLSSDTSSAPTVGR